MSDLTFDQLREANVARCEEVFHPLADWSPMDWLGCVTGELGEAAGLLKRQRRGEPVAASVLGDELADTVIYLDLLAARLGIDLGAAVIAKFDSVSRWKGSAIRLGGAWAAR